MEKGTEEYNDVARQLAQTNQKQIEINEAMKYSNKDLGATLSNLTKVSAGVVGAISSINGVMTLMGADSEEAMEAMKNIQAMMAIIQGLSAIDTAIKALKGLANAFKESGKAVDVVSTVELANAERGLQTAQAGTTVTTGAETVSIKANTAAKMENIAASNGVGAAGKTMGAGLGGATKNAGGLLSRLKNILQVATKIPPVILAVAAAVAAVFAGFAIWYAKENEAYAKWAEQQAEINNQWQQELVNLDGLVKAFQSQTTSLEAKKVLAKQINELTGDEIVKQNEITGKLELNVDKLNQYKKALRDTIELEFKRKQILDLMDEKYELQKDMIYEQTHLIGNLFKTESGLKEDIKDKQKEINKLLEEAATLTQKQAENTAKVATNTKKTTGGGVVKTLKEIVKEIKDIYNNLVNTMFDERAFKKIYNGVYDATDVLFDNIERIIKTRDLGDKLTKNFAQAIADKKNPLIRNFEVTVDNIFGSGKVEELEQKLIKAEAELARLIEQRKSLSDAVVKKKKEEVDMLAYQVESMKMLAEAAQKYADHVDEEERGVAALNRMMADNEEHNRNEIKYRMMLRNAQQKDNAETFRAITQAAEAYNEISQNVKEARREYNELMEQVNSPDQPLQNKAILDRVDYLFDYIKENEQAEYEALMALEDANYQARVKYLELYYDKQKKEAEKSQAALEQERYVKGGGVTDFNTEVDMLNLEMEAIKAQRAEIVRFYDETLEHYQEDAVMYEMIFAEKEMALTELQRTEEEKRAEITEATVKRQITAQKAYINVYQSLSTQALNIMSAVMDGMDENSEEYKNMRYAQGVIDTLSGTLAGFMSGVESGLPAPWNLVLAAATAASVFATGMIQLSNIKNEKLANGTQSNVNTGSFGEYDTLSYAQNNEILGNITDSRVYVLESDITSTQNRVNVVETQATF